MSGSCDEVDRRVSEDSRRVYRFVEELPGANVQARTLKEARENLTEAVELVLEANRALAEDRIRRNDVIREPLILAAHEAS